MPTPLLATKLHPPTPRRNAVQRPRLSERMSLGLDRKLTLVSASAGSGKTTAIGEWLATVDRPVAWLSLDDDHKDPALFLAYLIAAVQTIAPQFGATSSGALRSTQPPAGDAVLATLLSEMASAEPFILVLDDYHAVDAKDVEDLIGRLIEHLPRQVHVVIATRVDPALPLAKMRANDEITELRAADLRFSAPEARTFFETAVGVELSATEVEALVDRTEGWIAGLQLAGLSLQAREDRAGFIASFTGSHRFVLDYLIEEVLLRQPRHVQDFLLRTSVLDRMCGPLCDALMAESSSTGQEVLEHLENANLFVVPLDDERTWYRYHHLFAGALGQRLSKALAGAGGSAEMPGPGAPSLPSREELHQRASRWYEAQGLELEAFRHAAAANDVAAAERLMEGGPPEARGVPLHFRGVVAPIRTWLESLAPSVLDAKPSLWVALATVHTFTGVDTDVVEHELRAAEAAISSARIDAQADDLAGRIAGLRAMQAIPHQRADIALTESRRALELLRADNLPLRTAATWTLGFAHQVLGDRAAATEAFSQAVVTGKAAGNVMFTIAAATSLGQTLESQNDAHAAERSYRQAVELAGEPPLPASCEAHLGLARLKYEWNDVPAATVHAQLSLELAALMPNTPTPASCGLLLARTERARGDLQAATETLQEAERFANENGFTFHLRQVADEQVRTLLQGGHIAEAAELADEHALETAGARVHLARGVPAEALAVLQPLHERAVERSWNDELLKIGVLLALAHRANGDSDEAFRCLSEAIDLAEPAGYVRVFVDEGQAMAALLAELQEAEGSQVRGSRAARLVTLSAAFAAGESAEPLHQDQWAPQPGAQPLDEPLTERELEVLRLLADGLSNAAIGTRLFRALATIKGHNRMIFAKLAVRSRTEAIARARELHLL